jgi:hypothetical protein
MAVNINVPSQVRTFANLAAFPASGAVKTIYIAEDTNKTYRWDGSTYVEISASAATSLTIGTTPIASGTIGRVLFQGTGNVLQQSSSLFWDDAQVRFQLGATSTRILNFRPEDTTGAYGNSSSIRGGAGNGRLDFYSATNITELRDNIIILTSVGGPSVQVGSSSIALNLGGTRLQVAPTTGNVLINTTTDAGFRLDVNGTARVATNLFFDRSYATTFHGFNGNSRVYIAAPATNVLSLYTDDVQRIRIAATGNVLINTTTDAGFRLDVNGPSRIQNNLSVTGTCTLGGIVNVNGAAQSVSGLNTNRFCASTDAMIGSANAPDASAVLETRSTTKGFLPPKMTTTQRNAIASPAAGLIVYDTTLNLPHFFNGTIWVSL